MLLLGIGVRDCSLCFSIKHVSCVQNSSAKYETAEVKPPLNTAAAALASDQNTAREHITAAGGEWELGAWVEERSLVSLRARAHTRMLLDGVGLSGIEDLSVRSMTRSVNIVVNQKVVSDVQSCMLTGNPFHTHVPATVTRAYVDS